ncbi:MAG: hypothetical protein ACRD3M_17500 [Thermoanaerobaculia bacterium]
MGPDAPLVCRLDALGPRDRERHAELSRQLRSRICSLEELPRGFAFRFPEEDPGLAESLVEWVALDRRCCPFLEFELLLGRKCEPVILRLTGREGTKEFLAAEFFLPRVGP